MQELEEEGGPGRGAAAVVVIVIGVDNLRTPSPDETAIEEERSREEILHHLTSFPPIYSATYQKLCSLS